MMGEAGLFFGLWLRKPLQIAAVYPSSEYLADALARLADWRRPGMVLELGGGTGRLTRGLLRAGCPPERLITLEREEALAALLRREFPAISVVTGDATRIADLLDARGVTQLASVVSSLPIKWFPEEAQRAIVLPCLDRLGPGGRLLQMTNAFASPIAIERLGIAGRAAGKVWRNLPPAQIWEYRRSAAAAAAAA